VDNASADRPDRSTVLLLPPGALVPGTTQEDNSMDDGVRRIRAARWVIAVGRLYWALSVVGAAWSMLLALFLLTPAALLVAVVLAGLATLVGALVRGFAAHRRGPWQVLVGLAVLGSAGSAVGWLVAGPPAFGGLLLAGGQLVWLALLLHPDSQDWVSADEPRTQAGRGPTGQLQTPH
jgi:hypothetical protein